MFKHLAPPIKLKFNPAQRSLYAACVNNNRALYDAVDAEIQAAWRRANMVKDKQTQI